MEPHDAAVGVCPAPQRPLKRQRTGEDTPKENSINSNSSNGSEGGHGSTSNSLQSAVLNNTTTPPAMKSSECVDVDGAELNIASLASTSPAAMINNNTTATTTAHNSTTVMNASAVSPVLSVTGFADQRRLKQPTLAAFGMVSDMGVLRKEISDRDAQIDELRDRVESLEGDVSRREDQVQFLDVQCQQLQRRLRHFQQVMRMEMLNAAQKSRTEARRLVHQRHFDLGQAATWPSNGQAVWVEGNTMRQLIMQLQDVMQRREEVEALKRAAQNNVKQLARQERDREDSLGGSELPLALMAAQEEYQLRTAELVALSNTISDIQQQQARIDNEKKAFVKEVRRVSDEDASEFLAVPIIGEEDRYVLMHLLGKGGFSEVWKAFDLVEGRYVACKIHHIQREWSAQTRAHYLRHAQRELDIMRSLDHPHLTRMYDVFSRGDSMFISVMEYSHGMDLDTYLKRYRTMKEADARLILLQMTDVLRYLASLENPIIHYDLKPANILLHRDDPSILDIKVTDFGLSKIIGSTREGPSDNPSIELTSQGTGTYWYLPPECFVTSTTPRISNKVDIWSVGVIFYQMIFGRRPFAEGESQRKIWQEKLIVSSARSLIFPETPRVSDEAKDVISHCLAFNERERYDVFQLSQHPYLFRTSKRAAKAKSMTPSTTIPAAMSVGGMPE